ncbi:hypothetical protein LC048_14135 [Mesobacillus subterraneus]|nr:hypothetical protein [Mesobacillus subterraneus]WLR53661.1 hypothetical protein LC048_14135 [Mesobacillus subterraneus]
MKSLFDFIGRTEASRGVRELQLDKRLEVQGAGLRKLSVFIHN